MENKPEELEAESFSPSCTSRQVGVVTSLEFHSGGPLLHAGEIGDDSLNKETTCDRTELLPSSQTRSSSSYTWLSLFTLHYYQSYFNVTSAEVANRVLAGMVPLKYNLVDVLQPNPDLYGPFWLCMTLVFTTAISGNISSLFLRRENWEFHFHEVIVIGAAVYIYTWLVPVVLWGLLWWRGSKNRYTLLELLSVYGYCIAVFIPVTVLWGVNMEGLRWVLLALGVGCSGTVLVIALWKPLKNDNRHLAGAVLVLVFLMHVGLAVLFKVYYFSSLLPPQEVGNISATTPVASTVNSSSH